jgi:hypothetical protein
MKELQHASSDMAVEKIPLADIAFARPQVSRDALPGHSSRAHHAFLL